MEQKTSITFRIEPALRNYLRERAHRHNRSINREFISIVGEIMKSEEASGPSANQFPDASDH